MSPQFDQEVIEPIAVLPVLDGRSDRGYGMNFEKEIRRSLAEQLEKRGYSVLLPQAFTTSGQAPVGPLDALNAADVAQWGPDEAKSVLLVTVELVRSEYYVMYHGFTIKVVLSLVSKSTGIELWRDRVMGRSGSMGLISGLMIKFTKLTALADCRTKLLKTFPEKRR